MVIFKVVQRLQYQAAGIVGVLGLKYFLFYQSAFFVIQARGLFGHGACLSLGCHVDGALGPAAFVVHIKFILVAGLTSHGHFGQAVSIVRIGIGVVLNLVAHFVIICIVA